MMNENNLINKLMVSKKIMQRHNEMPRGNRESFNLTENEEVSQQQVKYNIPPEMMSEDIQRPIPVNNQPPTQEKILNSKLPDEIKKLMIEHPIHQPQSSGPVLTNELIEKASRLMNTDAAGKQMSEQVSRKSVQPDIDTTDLKGLIKETMKEILSENGLLIESVNKSNEVFSFKVGKHIFEGKVTKIKKLS